MKMCATLIFLLSISFTQVSHPVTLVVMILMQATVCCLLLMTLNITSWFSFILFLIFMGGLMVLFIYIASLASNEKFSTSYQAWSSLVIMASLMLLMILIYSNNQMLNPLHQSEQKMLSNMYLTNTSILTTLTMIYLLLTLLVVVKMTSKYEGPLRNMVYNS